MLQHCAQGFESCHEAAHLEVELYLVRNLPGQVSSMRPSLGEHADRPAARPEVDQQARRAFDIVLATLDGHNVAVSQQSMSVSPFADLLVFSRDSCREKPVLVVAPLAGAFPVLLRDLVLGLLPYRAPVAVTDWFDARYVPQAAGPFGLEDNILTVLDMIRSLGPSPHVVAVCQGAVAALAATALLSADESEAVPCSLTLVAGPIDPLANQTGAVRLARSHPLKWFAEKAIESVPVGYPGEGRLVYPKALQTRTLMAYFGRHIARGGELFWKLMDDDGEDPVRFPFVSLAMPQMDIPAEFFLGNIRSVFHNRDLSCGCLQVAGRQIDLRTIDRTALMTLEGEEDDIVGPGQTRAAHALCPAIPARKHEHILIPRGGHFSLFHGAICRSRVIPAIAEFIMRAERSSPGAGRRLRERAN